MTRCGRFLVACCISCMAGRAGSSEFLPVRIFWNASSTLLASRADVSINERLLSPEFVGKYGNLSREKYGFQVRTGEDFGIFGGNCPQMSQIALVSHQHDDNVAIGMVT
jgi:hypothetical protein